MPNKIPSILRAIAATPWAMQEQKLLAVLEFLEVRAAGGVVPAAEVARIKAEKREPVIRTSGKIAVLPLYGVISQRMSMMTSFSGGTSTEKFGAMFADVIDRSDVEAVVIDIDSPGGSVDGVPELAAQIFAARGKKPIIAVCNSLMASAAYWIGSAADEIVTTITGQTGSIGVFYMHTDFSAADEKDGVKRTLIKAGKYKTEGNPYEPLSAEAEAAFQSTVDDIYALFVGAVAKHRGVSVTAVRNGFGQGRTLAGKAAVSAKLADRVGTLEDVIAELSGGGKSAKRSKLAAALADSRHDHAGENPGVADARSTGRLAAALAGADVNGVSLQFAAAAPHNNRYLLIDPEADDAEADDETCETCGEMLTDDGECPNGHAQPDDDEDDEPDPADNQAADPARTRQAEGAAGAAVPTPTRQAPAPAKEQTVSTNTAPQNGASAPGDPSKISAADQIAILDLCAAHGKSVIDAKGFIEAGSTVQQVQGSILAEVRAGLKPVASVSDMKDRAKEQKFSTLGEMLRAVVQAGIPGGRIDPRLASLNSMNYQAGSAAGMSESVGSDGGFFIQPELLPSVIDPVYQDDPILSRVLRIPIGSGNGVRYNVVDEVSRADGFRWGGLHSYWASEAGTAAASKPGLRVMELLLKKLLSFAYLTDELMVDAPAAEALLTRAYQAELKFMLTAAIFRGPGGGQPQGFLNSTALQTIAIEGTQTILNSAQFLSLNLTKMLAAVPASLWGEVIWLYQQELLPYLMNASVAGSTAGAAVPVFIPMGGFKDQPFSSILGRPAYASEFCSPVGTVGDLIAIVPSQYHLGEKGGIQTAQSIHVKFLTDETTLRWTARYDGAPVWRKPVTPYKGAVARSPFVTLAARS